ncbi:NYN domain-containing protein [bacterium]|nr:NYN domain-containing protein [bacterium]
MLKAGIFLDMDNLMRNGGWGLRYDVIKALVAAQETTVLRANAYMAYDADRESREGGLQQAKELYRNAIRRNGFHLVLKEVKRYRDSDGQEVLKANADLDLAVDTLLQSDNLDYILLGTGDGDFLRLVRALQSRGKRVDLLSFANTSTDLRREVDNHWNGFLIPGLLPVDDNGGEDRLRGHMHFVNEERGFGFLTIRTGLGTSDVRDDIFCHITDVSRDGDPVDRASFVALRMRSAILEFELGEGSDGRLKAVNVREFRWERDNNRIVAPPTMLRADVRSARKEGA